VHRKVRLVRPRLPPGVERLRVEGLDIAGASIDIEVRRLGELTAVTTTPDESVSVLVEE